VDVFRPAAGLLKTRVMILLLVILLGCLCGVGAVFWYVRHLDKQELKSAAATETVEKVEKNCVENAAATPVENKTQTAAAENIPANNGGEKKEK
jgi:sensor domain CHASE-containing protein